MDFALAKTHLFGDPEKCGRAEYFPYRVYVVRIGGNLCLRLTNDPNAFIARGGGCPQEKKALTYRELLHFLGTISDVVGVTLGRIVIERENHV